MGLKSILDAVAALVTAQLPTVTIKFGESELASNTGPPRIVWIPDQEELIPPPDRGGTPGMLWLRQIAVEAHLWGADEASGGSDTCETLLAEVTRALHAEVSPKSYRIVGGRWGRGQEVVQFGQLYILTFHLLIPITRRAETTATLTTVTTTTKIVNPATGDESAGPTIVTT